MLSSDLNKLAASYAQIASEAIDPKGAARMDASKGETAETEDETNKRLMLGKYSPGSKKKKTDKCTSESFYLKRLQAMNPVFAEQYLAIAEILIEDGYENSRLIDNIVEAFPPEMVGYEFISALKAVNPRLHENNQHTEKRQARAIVEKYTGQNALQAIGSIMKNAITGRGAAGIRNDAAAHRASYEKKAKVKANITANDKAREKAGSNPNAYFDGPAKTKTKPATPSSSAVASQEPSTSRPASPPKNQGTGERSAAANDAKQQAAKAAANKSSTPTPTPSPKPAASTGAAKGPITTRAAIAAGSKEGQGPKSAASTYTGANDKTKVGRYKTLAQHRAAVAANKKSMSEGSVFESLKKARENVGASTCWDGYKAKGTKKKGGKDVPNCVKEEEIVEGIRDNDPEKGTKERKERLEKKRGMKVDDHPQYLETDMKKRQENNEKARKDMDKVKGQKNPHFEDVSHYDVILAFLGENNLIESVEEAEEIMMQLTGAQIVEIIDEFMNEGADGRVDRAYAVDGHGNKYRDYNNDGVSDRQRRMKAFAGKRTQMLMQPKLP
tara:strand:+ start:4693 stop:6360 length:1668 start_codon:yes stop_codon:yes gene_type:complete